MIIVVIRGSHIEVERRHSRFHIAPTIRWSRSVPCAPPDSDTASANPYSRPMVHSGRRTLLATALGAVVATPLLADLVGKAASADTTSDRYPSNTALYRDPVLTEGVDYARRWHRGGASDNSYTERIAFSARTTVIAPHGGGIEPGTSELCLAIAGFDPATPGSTPPAPAGGPTYDYWMFEGLRGSGNGELHVTTTHCDDGIATALCGGAMNVLALHGCTPADAGLDAGAEAIMIGGGNQLFTALLREELAAAGFDARDAADVKALAGVSPENIVNRDLLGGGGQLEITTPLRSKMFLTNTRAGRASSTTETFRRFVAAVRVAILRVEADQSIL